MHRILRTFYERWKYQHVDEAAFRAVAEEVSKRDLTTFFAQWLHTHRAVRLRGRPGPEPPRRATGYLTRVEVVRKAPGRFPQDVAVLAAGRHRAWRAPTGSPSASGWSSRRGPGRKSVLLDPLVRSHDWNMLNNRRRLGFSLSQLLVPLPATDVYFHRYFSTRVRRDRMTLGLQPVAWYNDAGGLTLGLRSRERLSGPVRAERRRW